MEAAPIEMAAKDDRPLVQLNDLKQTFAQPGGGRLTVLDIPSFELGRSQRTALIGQSGGGKTTLLHLLAGLIKPDSGTARVDGVELTRLSEQGRDRYRAATIGYVFQTFNLLPAFTAEENVRLGMTFGRRTGGRTGDGDAGGRSARDLLADVGLADRVTYKPSQLSVGQQQRVAIARALAGRPKLILADEPTANVDPASAEAVLELLNDACDRDGIAMIVVTHDMNVAQRFDRTERLEDINRAYREIR